MLLHSHHLTFWIQRHFVNSFASQTRPQKVLITVRVDQLETGIRPVQGALLWMVDLKRGLRNKRRRMSLQIPLHSCAPSEQERPRLGLCSKLAPPPPPPFKMSFRINCWNYSRKTKLSSALCSIVLHPHGMASTHTFHLQRTHYKSTIPKLKGEFTQKWVFCYHLLTLKSIQICTTYFLLWKTKEVIWKNF